MRRRLKAIAGRIVCDVRNFRFFILIFGIYYVVTHIIFGAFCPLLTMTGLPCAGCGMTRAVFFILTGQFTRSWEMNPMAVPVVLFAGYCFFWHYILGKQMKGFKIGIVILLAGLMITYIFRMYLFFPNRVPYVYKNENILELIFPFYREILQSLLHI